MRVCVDLIYHKAKIGVLLLAFTLAGCNTLKKVQEGERLLTQNTLYVGQEEVTSASIHSLIYQKPNARVLGYPLRLNLYNLAKENPDSAFQDWLHRKKKREKRLNRLLSQKQVKRLQESFLVKGSHEFLKQVGEAPVIIDTVLARKSVERLEAYYKSKGYFNTSGRYTLVEDPKKKKAALEYTITLQQPYSIDTVTKTISAPALDSLYERSAHLSLIKPGEQFDLARFNLERERLTTLFRNSGVYNFQESSIAYTILRDTTLRANDRKLEVQLNIEKPRGVGDSSSVHNTYRIHRLKTINIYTDYDIGGSNDSLKSTTYENYTLFYKDKLRYKPQALTHAVFLKKDSIYRDIDRTRTYGQLTNLNTFLYPNLQFIADSTRALLTSNIYLTPRPRHSLNLNFDVTHSNIQQIGTAFGVTAVTRNVFRGAETLNASVRGSIGLLSDAYLSGGNFTSEIGGNISLNFPRIWFPLNTEKVIPYYMLPQSKLRVGTNFQKNIGLDKQSFNTVLSYNWSPTSQSKHNTELLNIEFVRNVNPDNFYNVYQNTYNNLNRIASAFKNNSQLAAFYDANANLTIPGGTDGFIETVTTPGFLISQDTLALVKSIEERQQRLTENNLIVASNYTYSKNSKTTINDTDFYQYLIKLESAGNLLSLLQHMVTYSTNEAGQFLAFDIPFSQYLKTELHFIRHWEVATSRVIAFRSFFGLAAPYGNSNSIPFVRSYFAGGSNDNRAWNAYELGPGRTNNRNDFNEANLKLALNLEYRFPIAGDLKGAFFADAGNIWNVWNNENNPEAIFNGFSSLADVGLGTGLGLRYDFTYLVFRLDVGFKTYNPAHETTRRWFQEYNFKNAVFNIGINYPF